MNRRDFVLVLSVTAVLPTSLFWSPAQAQGASQVLRPVEGQDYYRLDKPVRVQAPPGTIEVVEFFWYSCPHCNAFEPTILEWSKKLAPDVVLRRVPVAFRDSFVPQQRLFYALEAMGLLPTLHAKVFYALHVEKINLDHGPAMVDWVAQQGVDRLKFQEYFESFSVSALATKATQLQNDYRVEGVPALGVAGRYYTDGELARTLDRALKVVDTLVAEVRPSARAQI